MTLTNTNFQIKENIDNEEITKTLLEYRNSVNNKDYDRIKSLIHPIAIKSINDEQLKDALNFFFYGDIQIIKIIHDISTPITKGLKNPMSIFNRSSEFYMNGDHILVNSFSYFEMINGKWLFIEANDSWSMVRDKFKNIPPKTVFPKQTRQFLPGSRTLAIAKRVDEMTSNINDLVKQFDEKCRLRKQFELDPEFNVKNYPIINP